MLTGGQGFLRSGIRRPKCTGARTLAQEYAEDLQSGGRMTFGIVAAETFLKELHGWKLLVAQRHGGHFSGHFMKGFGFIAARFLGHVCFGGPRPVHSPLFRDGLSPYVECLFIYPYERECSQENRYLRRLCARDGGVTFVNSFSEAPIRMHV